MVISLNTIFLPERYGSQSGSCLVSFGSHFQFTGALAPVLPCFHIHCILYHLYLQIWNSIFIFMTQVTVIVK